MKSLGTNKPHLVITVGIPGSGKTYFAVHFAETFKAPIVNFDRIRKDLFGSQELSKEEIKTVAKVTDYMLEEVFKTGRTIVYEGQTNSRAERANMAKKARDAGYEPLFIWVQTEPLTARKRATKKVDGISPMTIDEFDITVKRFNVPQETERVIVISGKHTYATQLKIVLKHLVEPRTPIIERTPISRPANGRNFLIR